MLSRPARRPVRTATASTAFSSTSLDGVTWTPTVTRTTDALGVADFTGLQANKAGGYTLSATSGFDGIAGATFTSNLFNLQHE